MIKFSGTISMKCRNFLLNKLKRICFFSGFFSLLFTSFLIVLIIRDSISIYIYMLIPICGMLLFCFMPKMIIKMYHNRDIEITKDYMASSFEGKSLLRDISDVKIVVDYGEWYDITFYFPHKDIGFICQKDLIVEGTIEEFEKLFEGKIVRKYKTKD